MNKADTVNLFFACDDGYIPFLAVTLSSIKKHRCRERDYSIRILNTGISEYHKETLFSALGEVGFNIQFVDISERIEKISERLHTRDYYSKSTYFRLFIPELYPSLDKALYLDCDIVVQSDIAELYDVELQDNLVGAVADGFVQKIPRLHGYVTERVGVRAPIDYFNAGVLLMNLKEMRKVGFEDRFIDLISKVTFEVAQDQDYLNALCMDRRTVIGEEWNCMPGFTSPECERKLIHYNLDSKPWHKDGLEFGDIFWKYVEYTPYAERIRDIRRAFKDEEKAAKQTFNMIDFAEAQAMDTKKNLEVRKALMSVWTQTKETKK